MKNTKSAEGTYPFLNFISKRLCGINQRSAGENLKKSMIIYIALAVLAAIYFFIALSLFHSLWYHVLFSLISTLIFIYLCYEYYFEKLNNKVKADLPKCCRKLAHYVAHYKGNVIHALKAVEEKGPESTRLYIAKIRKSFESVNLEDEIEAVKDTIPYTWLKMLCTLMIFGKQSGSTGTELSEDNSKIKGSNHLEKGVRRITNVLSLVNIDQGYNNADLHGIEIFMFLSPYLIILATELFNRQILIEMSIADVYSSIQAQTIKAMIFLAGNLSALLIHWMRRQQN